jgi:hypothetical protein
MDDDIVARGVFDSRPVVFRVVAIFYTFLTFDLLPVLA